MALTSVVMVRRERAVLIVPMHGGLAVHTLLEERNLNNVSGLFGGVVGKPVDPEMMQLVTRQVGVYDRSDVEDRYEFRMRDIVAAKLKGEGAIQETIVAVERGNVIDLMVALEKSLGQTPDQPVLKSKQTARKVEASTATASSKAPRKRA